MTVCHFCVFVCICWVQEDKLTADSTPATVLDNQSQVLPSNWVCTAVIASDYDYVCVWMHTVKFTVFLEICLILENGARE